MHYSEAIHAPVEPVFRHLFSYLYIHIVRNSYLMEKSISTTENTQH